MNNPNVTRERSSRGRRRMPDDQVSQRPTAQRNRTAQQAFRDRQRAYITSLETEVIALQRRIGTPHSRYESSASSDVAETSSELVSLRNQIASLSSLNNVLFESLFESQAQLDLLRSSLQPGHPLLQHILPSNTWAYHPLPSICDPDAIPCVFSQCGPLQHTLEIAQLIKSIPSLYQNEPLVDAYFQLWHELLVCTSRRRARILWFETIGMQNRILDLCGVVDRMALLEAFEEIHEATEGRHVGYVVNVTRMDVSGEVEVDEFGLPMDRSEPPAFVTFKNALRDIASIRRREDVLHQITAVVTSRQADSFTMYMRMPILINELYSICSNYSERARLAMALEVFRLQTREVQKAMQERVHSKLEEL